jgi:hypothetical protein
VDREIPPPEILERQKDGVETLIPDERVSADPDDDYLYYLALDTMADYLVSGDPGSEPVAWVGLGADEPAAPVGGLRPAPVAQRCLTKGREQLGRCRQDQEVRQCAQPTITSPPQPPQPHGGSRHSVTAHGDR